MQPIDCAYKKLTPTAKVPSYAEEYAIGADVYADLPNGPVVLEDRQRALIPTGIAIAPNEFGYVRLAPRSGLSVKGIDLGAGVVDVSYRGEIKAVLINNSGKPFTINHHDRICQGIFELSAQMRFNEKETLPESDRGAGGFGSTGV